MKKPSQQTGQGGTHKFEEAARALGCDESEERFNDALGKIARVKPKPDIQEKIKEPKTDKPAK